MPVPVPVPVPVLVLVPCRDAPNVALETLSDPNATLGASLADGEVGEGGRSGRRRAKQKPRNAAKW
ncbi:hypothetical protein [Amycolatopsis sp. NPDC052450]|uniref:hypothetical protein n=1 Tax=Amycolatopsis sp. NPDC052450 TaxID=3363937 RepID=UPI0037C773F1